MPINRVESQDGPNCELKAIIFQCESSAEKDAILNHTNFKLVGPYLVSKSEKEDNIWVTFFPTTKTSKRSKAKDAFGDGPIGRVFQQRIDQVSRKNSIFLKANKWLTVKRQVSIPLAYRMTNNDDN